MDVRPENVFKIESAHISPESFLKMQVFCSVDQDWDRFCISNKSQVVLMLQAHRLHFK